MTGWECNRGTSQSSIVRGTSQSDIVRDDCDQSQAVWKGALGGPSANLEFLGFLRL